MKLNDMMTKSLREVLENCQLIEHKVHTDKSGNIQAIELKYIPSDLDEASTTSEKGWDIL